MRPGVDVNTIRQNLSITIMHHVFGRNTLVVLIISLFLSLPLSVYSQYFGQNKVNHKTYDWYYIRTENFKIYHPKGSYKIAEFAGWEAEEALKQLEDLFNYNLQDRITIVVYPSHNAFAETNVSTGIQGESTGGFTEFLKNRVVIPFEGSYEQFRHVIHHELTHAVMLRMLYGEGMGSILTGIYRMPLPLWFTEGLAEYTSRFGWDNEADLYMRDAVINDYLPPINQLGGYFYYKGGQSILYFIEQRYGREKVGEILHRLRSSRDLNRALKLSVGFNIEELSKRWHRYLKREIWPSSVTFELPEDFSEKITDHEEWYNFVNNSPALSPDGDKLIFLSNKSDYFSLYMMSTITGEIEKRLVQGEKSDLFEQLHWLRPGIDWSPDSRQITFAAKAGEQDALYTLNVETGKVTNKFLFNLDGLFSPSWSPDGKRITFTGHINGQSDIYVVDLENGNELIRVTDDIYSDFDPAWAPDNRHILFTSDRGDNLEPDGNVQIWKHNFRQIDLYLVDSGSKEIRRITDDPYEDRTPKWTPNENTISFISDRNGCYNLYLMDMNSGDSWAITDVATGVFQPSWSSSGTVAFASFFNAGYDIYLYKNPFDPNRRKNPLLTGHMAKMQENDREKLNLSDATEHEDLQLEATQIAEEPPPTNDELLITINRSNNGEVVSDTTDNSPGNQVITEQDSSKVRIPKGGGVRLVPDENDREGQGTTSDLYRHYVFEPSYLGDNQRETAKVDSSRIGPLLDENGNFIQKKYKLKFSPDVVNASAGYSTFFGLQGVGQIMFSDVLGDHIMLVNTDLYYSFENSNFSFYYFYLPNRFDIGGGVFHNVYFFDYGWIRDRNYGASFNLRYPLSRYRRLEFSSAFVNIDRDEWIDLDENGNEVRDYVLTERRHFVLPSIAYVSDNTVPGWTGPMNGRRIRLDFSWSPLLESNQDDQSNNKWGIDFKTVSLDARQYFHFSRDYSVALRLSGASSWGKSPQRFFMGGVSNWINRRFAHGTAQNGIRDEINDIYFSGFATPLRGTDYYEKEGSTYLLVNSEFRYPLVRQLLFGWPLPLFFYNIRGAIFWDIGAAWGTEGRHDDSALNIFKTNQYGKKVFDDVATGYGWGFRVNLGMFLLKWDMAWENDWNNVSKPSYYVSIGTDF